MASKNQMILIDREEAELLAERDLTDQVWQVIDECIKNTVDEVVNG